MKILIASKLHTFRVLQEWYSTKDELVKLNDKDIIDDGIEDDTVSGFSVYPLLLIEEKSKSKRVRTVSVLFVSVANLDRQFRYDLKEQIQYIDNRPKHFTLKTCTYRCLTVKRLPRHQIVRC